MSRHVIFAVVFAQVLIFQFAAIRLSRAMPDYLVGVRGLPAELAERVADFKRRVGRFRFVAGAVLALAAIASWFFLPIEREAAKLVLAVISVVSAALGAGGYMVDRNRIARLTAQLPEAHVRAAALARRTLALHYSAAWEALPMLVFLATAAGSLWAWSAWPSVSPTHGGGQGLLVIPLIQGAFVLAAFAHTLRLASSGTRLGQRSKAFLGTPQQALGVETGLGKLNLRSFLVARILVVLLLGAVQAERLAGVWFTSWSEWADLAGWILVGLLMLLFLLFLVRSSIISRPLRY